MQGRAVLKSMLENKRPGSTMTIGTFLTQGVPILRSKVPERRPTCPDTVALFRFLLFRWEALRETVHASARGGRSDCRPGYLPIDLSKLIC